MFKEPRLRVGHVLVWIIAGVQQHVIRSELLDDLHQAANGPAVSAFLGGVIFNLANILLVAAIDSSPVSCRPAAAAPVGEIDAAVAISRWGRE